MVDRQKAADAVTALLAAFEVDDGEYTADTAKRVSNTWVEVLEGYDEDPRHHLRKRFAAPPDPGLVIVTGVRLASTCAHHLLPIVGLATVAYRPNQEVGVVGLSKLARVVHGYARRLQLQERLGYQVADAIHRELTSSGAACAITATHSCMTWRGLRADGALTTTRALAGSWTESHPDVIAVLAEHRASLTGHF